MFAPNREIMSDMADIKAAIAHMGTNITQMRVDGSRASVLACLGLLSKAITLYLDVNKNLPEFLISSANIPFIPSRAVQSAKLFANRDDMLALWPQGGVVCEVGTAHGDFAKKIWRTTAPKRMHIVDVSVARFDKGYFSEDLKNGNVVLHEGKSHDVIPQFSQHYFDVAYIDGDHWYDTVVGDIQAMLPKVKAGGLLVFNDYTAWSPLESAPYGILPAVNQLLQDENYEIAGFALSPGGICSVYNVVSPPGGYHDIAIRKLRD